MKKRNLPLVLFIFVLILFLLLSFACNFSDIGKESPAEQTANVLSTSLPLTHTAAQEETNRPTITRTPIPSRTSSPTRTQTVPGTEKPADTAVPPTATVSHQVIPSQPDSIKVELDDTNSQTTADKGYAPEGDVYINGLLLERPFTQDMKYRPDLDILSANIGNDANFIYVTIHLQGTNPDTGTLAGWYGVELDMDADGRGDYLIWTAPPASSEWSIDNVQVLADADNDIGNATPLKSDAPSDIQGDGYEQILFSAQQLSDPDAAWSRLGPNENTIQIAFKSSIFDEDKFLWGVWADDGLKNPGMFDYNDAITLENAGSPLQNSQYFPLKELYNVDSTCRSAFGRSLSGTEPGLCGNLQNDVESEATSVATKLPNLTELPEITLPVTP